MRSSRCKRGSLVQDVKNYCNTKMPQHFHRLFSVLKIELKTEFCFLNHHLMSVFGTDCDQDTLLKNAEAENYATLAWSR